MAPFFFLTRAIFFFPASAVCLRLSMLTIPSRLLQPERLFFLSLSLSLFTLPPPSSSFLVRIRRLDARASMGEGVETLHMHLRAHTRYRHTCGVSPLLGWRCARARDKDSLAKLRVCSVLPLHCLLLSTRSVSLFLFSLGVCVESSCFFLSFFLVLLLTLSGDSTKWHKLSVEASFEGALFVT